MKSNCLLEALKAKIISPLDNKICRRGSWMCVFKHQWPHFYWYHKPHDKYYCFSGKLTSLPWLKQLWYEGEIIEFKWHNISQKLE